MSTSEAPDDRDTWALATITVIGFLTSVLVAPLVRAEVVEVAENLAGDQPDVTGWIVSGWAISWAPPLYVAAVLLVGAGLSLLRLEWSLLHAPVLMVLNAAMFAVLVPAVDEGSRPMDTREDFARWFPRMPDVFYEASSSSPLVAIAAVVVVVLLGAAFGSADRLSRIGRQVTPVVAGCAVWTVALGTLVLMLLV